MRQAGRSLPEYRELREGIGMIESCLTPNLASEITLQPVRRHKVDAAIFFSDIIVPLVLAGVDIDITPGVGPTTPRPYDTAERIEELVSHKLTESQLAPITEAVSLTVAQLGTTPLIGFGGAPFTLAAYLVEGKPSRDHLAARALMHTDPVSWNKLTFWAAELTGIFLRTQVLAGASAVQLFDSWAGGLSHFDYAKFVAPASEAALAAVSDLPVRKIHFGVGTQHLLPEMKNIGVDAMGVDYRTDLAEANRILGKQTVLQGNIDPALLRAPWPVLKAHVLEIVEKGRATVGHILNLGHGVPPNTNPQVLTDIVDLVHNL